MPRTGLIVASFLVLVAVAVGASFYAGIFGQESSLVRIPKPQTSKDQTTDTSPERKLVAQVMDVAFKGGFAATFSDKDSGRWRIGPGHKVEAFSLGSTGPVMARLSSASPREKPFVLWSELGLSIELPAEFANSSSGKGVEIGIVARQAQSNPSSAASAVYATRQAGNSEWRSMELSGEFQLIRFPYRVPETEGGYKVGPMVVINADSTGNGGAIELLGIYVRIIPNS